MNILSAQDNGIIELSQVNTLSKATSKTTSKTTANTDREEFYNLVYKLHPTEYVQNENFNDNIKNVASASKLTFNDTNSFNLLNTNNSKFETIELISITLKLPNDLNNTLDLSNNSSFGELKYVYIKSYFECSEQQIRAFINCKPNVRIFYKIQKPS